MRSLAAPIAWTIGRCTASTCRPFRSMFTSHRRGIREAGREERGPRRPITGADATPPAGKERLPVYNVSWHDAVRYAPRGARKHLRTEGRMGSAPHAQGRGGSRLPVGQRLRAGTGGAARARARSSGRAERLGQRACAGRIVRRQRVMGNVWEWVADSYGTTYYSVSPVENPSGPERGLYKVISRGGGRAHPNCATAPSITATSRCPIRDSRRLASAARDSLAIAGVSAKGAAEVRSQSFPS